MKIFRLKPTLEYLKSLVGYEGDECIIWPYAKHPVTGYGIACGTTAHRVMCSLAYGEQTTRKVMARHTCRNGRNGCVNPNHLCWGSGQDNADDRERMGNTAKGARNANSLLTEEAVISMRQMHKDGLSQLEISKMFGVTHSCAHLAISGKSWRHVPL